MMEGRNGNIWTHKTNGKPPYSLETPYGFRLDLDFLKYVDDIEKGNTVRRVPVRRRSPASRASTLPRHLHPTPWASTGALGPASRLPDARNHGYASWVDGSQSLAELEARIKEFDEQPLGEHIRPHLLRASSLPLTVLLGRESTDHLSSCEDVSCSSDGPRTEDSLSRKLKEALERVEELETEARLIPELKAHIVILQEERERLRLGLNVSAPPINGTDRYTSSHYGTLDKIKRPRHVSPEDANPSHEWRSSTDLDELLTVTSLQAKVAALEQKLHETGLELQRVSGLLREQQDVQKLEHLTRNPADRVRGDSSTCPEAKAASTSGQRECVDTWTASEETAAVVGHIKEVKVLLEQQDDQKPEHLTRNPADRVRGDLSTCPDAVTTSGQRSQRQCVDTWTASDETAAVVGHIKEVKVLLEQQWECICEGHESGNPKVNSLQQEIMALVDLLTSYYTRVEPQKGGRSLNGGQSLNGGRSLNGGLVGHSDFIPGHDLGLKDATETVQTETSWTDGVSNTGETLSPDFLAACRFLKDHVENVNNPDDDETRALVVLFEHWFRAAAEQSSDSSSVGEYLREVKTTSPALLVFLVNLADANGNTALHYSVSHCNYSVVSLILDTGVSDVSLQNNAGYTAVMLASLTAPDGPGGLDVVRRLMEISNVNILSSQTGQTALHLAVRRGRVVLVRLLLSCGADANVQDRQGTTALMLASERGYTHVARLLLERTHCDVTLTDKRGQTAYSLAKQNSHTDTAALLKAHVKSQAL